ncbi:12347_t:CDS:2 [Funneliformis mosseae]|uniref:12347_t:CDS:1 n=1 Tax=Funneliformis mosseae TaxID=27381 RepID=A0A9N8VCJ9_FUNMO|nr:12347_t:CDS:2 [Funneliformis mosseae]
MQSLATFMLTLLRRYEKNDSDMWMSIGLLTVRAGFHFVYTFPMIPSSNLSENPTSFYGGMKSEKSESGFYFSNLTFVDIIIDGYVMYRLMQILKNNPKIGYSYPKDMFTIVMYWNFLTVVTAFLYHMLIALNITENKVSITNVTTQIALSYLITIDTGIKGGNEKVMKVNHVNHLL